MREKYWMDYESSPEKVRSMFVLIMFLGKLDVIGVHQSHVYGNRWGEPESFEVGYDI